MPQLEQKNRLMDSDINAYLMKTKELDMVQSYVADERAKNQALVKESEQLEASNVHMVNKKTMLELQNNEMIYHLHAIENRDRALIRQSIESDLTASAKVGSPPFLVTTPG